MDKNTKHTLLVDYESGVVATAVGEVSYFNEKEVKLNLLTGVRLLIVGEKLKINGFDRSSGELKLSGVVYSVKYCTSTSFKFKKFFG